MVLRDFGIFTYPNAYFQRESFWQGQWPLWNPLNNCGVPFLAQWNTTPLYPPALLYLLLPLTWGLNLFLLAHLFLAGFGMYLLASQWTGNRVAGAVAGTAFAFNGMTLNCLIWTSNLATLACLPWVILFVERAWTKGGHQMLYAILAGAMQMMAGAPEIIVFTWLIVGLQAIRILACDRAAVWRILGRTAIMIGVISLLAAAQLLPFLDLLSHSGRAAGQDNSLWTIPSWGWANLFVPLFHCFPSGQGVWYQPDQSWATSYYLGIGVLVLALAALGLGRTRQVWWLAGLAVFGYLVAMGDPGGIYPAILKIFPPLGFMRYPIKFYFLTVFAVPMLAAFAVAGWQAANAGKKRWLMAPTILAAGVIGGILWHVHTQPMAYEQWPAELKNGVVRIILLTVVAGIILGGIQLRSARWQRGLAGLLLAVIWLDGITHVPQQNPGVDPMAFAPGLLTSRLDAPPREPEGRMYMTRASRDFFYTTQLPDLLKDYTGRRCALLGDCNILDGLPTADGFYSMRIKEQRDLFEDFFQSPTNAFPSGLADLFSIAYISDEKQVLNWQSRPMHLPWYTVGAKPIFTATSNMPAYLMDPNFDARKEVFLPNEAQDWLTHNGATAATRGTVHPEAIAAQRMQFKVEADAPTVFMLTQTYYHPWVAFVDGKEQPIWCADYAFQAVEIPGGKHELLLVYRDRWFEIGLGISLATLLACLGYLKQIHAKAMDTDRRHSTA